MGKYLFTLALGPVQGLIGAARRTRDLWAGSWLLSEVSRAAALALHQTSPGGLIFPCPAQPETELQPQDRPGDSANIANILRIEIEAEDEAALHALAATTRVAAQARLETLGDEILRKLPELRTDVWQAQISDILEVFAAWTPIDDGDYGQASERLGRTLAARKATRDFSAAALDPEKGCGLPKSSLDGAFETVLPKERKAGLSRHLALSKNEQLDALGVIKRRGGDSDQFTAFSRIAAEPWVQGLEAAEQQGLKKLYEPLVEAELATRGNEGIYAALPYDGQYLYPFRLDNAIGLAQGDPQGLEQLRAFKKEVSSISRDRGLPVPYAAILQADGDRMGELLSQARTSDQARDVSRALQGFADRVRGLVREHRGHAVYSGGDDVLALLPLAGARPCARALAKEFRERMAPVARDLGLPEDKHPTLSVGLGIGHLMETLGSLRDRAARAEQAAKGNDLEDPEAQRNALAIIMAPRSGAEIAWRARWDDTEAFADLTAMTDGYREGRLSSRLAYALRDVERRLYWVAGDAPAQGQAMRLAELQRALDRTRNKGGTEAIDPELARRLLRRAGTVPLGRLADTLVVARWLAARVAADLEERP